MSPRFLKSVEMILWQKYIFYSFFKGGGLPSRWLLWDYEIVRLFTQMNPYFLVMNSKRCINEIEQKQNMDEGLRNSKLW